MVAIYVDGDACPVREEVYRVAERFGVAGLRCLERVAAHSPTGRSNVSLVTVGEGADVADDWIAERVCGADICVTSDIPLAARCLASGARHWHPTAKYGRRTISAVLSLVGR